MCQCLNPCMRDILSLLGLCLHHFSFLGSSVVKNLPAMQETQEKQVWSLGQKYPLKEEVAIQPNIPAWKILWIDEPGRLQSIESQKVGHDWTHATSISVCCGNECGSFDSVPIQQELWESSVLNKITLVANSRNLSWLVKQNKTKMFQKYTGIFPVIKENRPGPGSLVRGVNRSFL